MIVGEEKGDVGEGREVRIKERVGNMSKKSDRERGEEMKERRTR